jgi:hypothetical protein
MPPRDAVQLGPLTRTIANAARWLDDDKFPARQEWADEVERVLQHLQSQGVFERFLPRLRDVDAKQRDAKLAEARVSFFLFRNGFRILEYDPSGADCTEGDLLVQWQDATPIFVETKGPSWRGELLPRTEAERARMTPQQWEEFKERIRKPKEQDLEARWADPAGQALWVVEENALKKLFDDRPSLVAVADDLFVTPVGLPNLKAVVEQHMGRAGFDRLGAILFLKPECRRSAIEYRIDFVVNEGALPPCRLPEAVSKGFAASAEQSRLDWSTWYSRGVSFSSKRSSGDSPKPTTNAVTSIKVRFEGEEWKWVEFHKAPDGSATSSDDRLTAAWTADGQGLTLQVHAALEVADQTVQILSTRDDS